MNIFIVEMKAHRKSLIIWTFGIIFMVGAGMGKFAALSTSGQSMNELLAQMPKSMLAMLGIGTLDLSKASGYYGMLFLYLVLMATIHAVMLGADIISKEERDKTAEFLLVKPISRNKVITSKLLAGTVNILIFNIVTLVSSIIIVGKYSKGESVSADIVVLMVGMLILQLMFMLIGTAIAAACKNSRSATAISTGVILITFILSIAIDIDSKIKNLKYLTPFKYYEAKDLMFGGGLQWSFVILSIIIISVMICITYVFYKKRDLSI
ncbi:ABC transporter permease [Clostridium bowmanii]|uniref:ABC transporter permease subunit n=1 Tax=Clostridium bowmanii TaxID=132925 RepID=UPI001C0ABE59|nr:ABC transporter permease subunit [Clostridium bowmanii]MBU3190155.1 ABC transporter permease [Clostridium bowmanii]MCA1074751.1 ABC transporter permease [Clostridium bowmanii]